MGISGSKHRRHRHDQNQNQDDNQQPSFPSTAPIPNHHSSSSDAVGAVNNSNRTNTNPSSSTISNTDSLTQNYPRPSNPIHSTSSSSYHSWTNTIPSTPSQPPSHHFAANSPCHPPWPTPPTIPTNYYNFNSYRLPPPTPPFPYNNLPNGWVPPRSPNMGPPVPTGPSQAPPAYVDHNHAKKIKNEVNVHKDSIRVVVDENCLDSHLVSFTFDAVVDGSITIFYFPKEGPNCTFIPSYPEIYSPRKIPFKKGLGQKFCQPSGTGIDLGFFELDDLSKPSPGEDIFPLVISAEASLPSFSMETEPDRPRPTTSPAQITQAVLEKSNEDHFRVKVVKQILWIDGVRYELREIYGIDDSNEAGVDNSESGKECVICMTEPKDTAVLPCRHLCLCIECAKELRLQSNNCPICRQPIQELMEIKIDEESSS